MKKSIEYYTDGSRYEGEWRDNNKHGRRAYYFASGDKWH